MPKFKYLMNAEADSLTHTKNRKNSNDINEAMETENWYCTHYVD